MNARERFNRIMNFEQADRLPVLAFEPYESFGLDAWRKEGLPLGVTPEEFLGMDRFNHIPVVFGPIPAFEQTILSETEDDFVQIDWMGSAVRRHREAPDMYYGHVDHAVKTRADWDIYKQHFLVESEGRIPSDLPSCAALMNSSELPTGLMIFPFFFRLGFYAMGMERFLTAFYEEPALIHDMFEYFADFVLRTIRPILKTMKIDYAAFGEDLAYKTNPHMSPAIYKEFWLPYQDPIIKEIKDSGVKVISQYTAGNIEVMLPMLLEHGFNTTWPLERGAGMDPVKLRKEYGHDLKMAGGVSKEALIGGPDAIDRELEAMMPVIQDGGFIPAIDDMVPPEVTLSSYKYYVEALKGIRL